MDELGNLSIWLMFELLGNCVRRDERDDPQRRFDEFD